MKKALEWAGKSAEQNNPDALVFLTYFSQDKVKAEQYAKKAIEYYTKAAKQGDNDAYDTLLTIYSKGIGVKKDEKKAFELALALATEERQLSLAVYYHNGLGVEANKKKAIECYKKSALSSTTDFSTRELTYMLLASLYEEE